MKRRRTPAPPRPRDTSALDELFASIDRGLAEKNEPAKPAADEAIVTEVDDAP